MNRLIVLSLVMVGGVAHQHETLAADSAQTYDVGADGDAEYSSIQAAIDAAPAGSVVRVGSGQFDGPLFINKSITLEGADKTFVTSNWVNLHELLIEGKGVGPAEQGRFKQRQDIAVKDEHGEGPVTAELWQTFGPKPTLNVKEATSVEVRGLSFSMPGSVQKGGFQIFHMVLLENAGVTLDDCAFVGSAVGGLKISGDSKVPDRWYSVVRYQGRSRQRFENTDSGL